MDKIEDPNNLPIYNIKAISQLTGLLPVTLRAWERRYGLPKPKRGDQGYRLYSEEDLRTLQWLKAQVDAGMSISRAVEYLIELRDSGKNPLQSLPQKPVDNFDNIQQFQQELLKSLLNIDESNSTLLLRRSFALFSLNQVLLDIIQPVMVEIGEMWHRKEIAVASEHFATQFFIQYLNSILGSLASPSHNGIIISACVPGEMHQLGILMLSVLLRWEGWDVRYLGPNLKLERLEEGLSKIHPRMIMLSSTSEATAKAAENLPEVISKFPDPKPLVVLGGQGFKNYKLDTKFPILYLDSPLPETVRSIENLMKAFERRN